MRGAGVGSGRQGRAGARRGSGARGGPEPRRGGRRSSTAAATCRDDAGHRPGTGALAGARIDGTRQDEDYIRSPSGPVEPASGVGAGGGGAGRCRPRGRPPCADSTGRRLPSPLGGSLGPVRTTGSEGAGSHVRAMRRQYRIPRPSTAPRGPRRANAYGRSLVVTLVKGARLALACGSATRWRTLWA